MLFLLLAILCTLTINVMIKAYELRGTNTRVVIASNYIAASLLGWALALARGIDGLDRTTLLLGLGGGILWPLTFFLQMWGIRHYGISLAGTISRLSLSVPVLFAILFLGERLTLLAGVGILGVLAAFLLLAPVRAEAGTPVHRRAIAYFPVLVLCFGVADLWVNLFNTFGQEGARFLFVVLVFTASGVLSWGALLAQRVPVDRGSFVRGLCLGVPNFGSTFFLMESLKAPAFADLSAVVYALYSAATATLIFGMGPAIWREKVTRGNLVGVLVALGAIVLLNL